MNYPWSNEPILDEPDIDYPPGQKLWRLTQEARVQLPDGAWIVIPEGLQWDLASIPRFFWRVVSPHELSLIAPLVHDWLYIRDGKVEVTLHHPFMKTEPMNSDSPNVSRRMNRSYTRKEADSIFLQFMLRQQVPKFRARLAHRAVRMFGGRYWKGQR